MERSHQRRILYPELRTRAWRSRNLGRRGELGWESLPTARLRPFEERHVQLADVITSFRRHWRAAVAAVLLVFVVLGLFLTLQHQIRPADRWRASVQILVPARDEEGNLPPGVPPSLLQGQKDVALSGDVTGEALTKAGLDPEAENVSFDFDTNELGDIITLTATAPSEEEAQSLANGYASAYLGARRATVAAGSKNQSQQAQATLGTLQQRLVQVEAELEATDPDLLESLPDVVEPLDGTGDNGDNATLPNVGLPATTPIATQLLVYERQDLLGRIEAARRTYAESSSTALVPHAFATLVERVEPKDVTPEPMSPLIPLGVALGLGVLVAFGVPLLLDRFDHSIRDSRSAGSALDAPVLSTIPAPRLSQAAMFARPGSPGGHA